MGVCAMDMLVLICNMVYWCVCHGFSSIDMQHGVWVCVPWICWYLYATLCMGVCAMYMLALIYHMVYRCVCAMDMLVLIC